jgi:hypothetical protein
MGKGMKEKTIIIRVYFCGQCRHIFRTPKRPKKCNKCGNNGLILFDSYKQRRSNFRRRSRRQWITPEDFYEKKGVISFKKTILNN